MKKKILLVEDEAIIAMTESKMLQKHRYEVVTTHKGEKAVDAVENDPEISLILMDIDLGKGIDGTEAAQKILDKHDIPIAFLSSHTEPEVVEKTEGITSYGYIVKNSGETVLLASIKMAFRLYEAHLELKRQKVNLNAALTKYEQKSESLQESEALYRNLMENSVDGVELLDEEGRFLNVNQSECDMLGYFREEMLTMRIADIDPNYEEDGFYKFWKEKPKGDSFLFETLHKHKNGTLIPVEVNGIFFEVNSKKYIYGVARDITERKQTEYEIKTREENLHTTLNSIGDAVIATDRHGNIQRMNPVAETLCGWTSEKAIGKKLEQIFHIINADTRDIVDNPVGKVLQSGEIVGLANHTVIVSRDGQEYQIADSAAPIKDDEGNINGVVLVFRDVTEQYEKDRQLRERVKELDCLYNIAEIIEEPNTSLSYILQKTAEVVPQSWRYPEKCGCRITLNSETYQSNNFAETKWKLSSDIIVENVVSGKVEVCYLEERPTADEGPFLKEERKLIDAIPERLGRVIERRQAEENLRSIEWMLSNKSSRKEDYFPEYGDVSELNKYGLILSSVGKDQLRGIASEYLDLLETSTAIYEKNGDYALGIFTSGWCQLLDSASRRLCNTEDNKKALESGKWLCHESCWEDAHLSMKEGGPVEIECNGGIKMYAVPVRANGEVVGAINFGYGNPPTDKTELKKLSEMYNIPIDELRKNAEAYKTRPQFIIDYAKERIQTAAETLGYLIERKQTEKALKQEQFFLSSVLDNIKEAVIICNENGEITRFNESARRLHQLPEKQIPAERWAEYYDLYYPDSNTPLATKDIPLFRALQGEDVNNMEIIVKPKKDTARLLSCSGQQIKDENGKKCGAVIAMHDITELKNSRDRYKRLVNNSPNLIMETDVDTHEIINCNPAMAKNLGTSIPEILGKRIDDFIPPNILNKRIEVSQKAIENGKPQILEDGRNGKYFHTTYIPIVSNERRSIQTITIDVTNQKKSENMIKDYAKRLELTMEAADLAWWEMDIESGKVNFNRKKADMLGYNPDQFQHYEDFLVLIYPDDYEPAMSSMRALLDGTKDRYDIEYRIKAHSGNYRWYHDIGTISRSSEEGTPLKVAGIVLDITNSKQNEENLRKAVIEKDFLMKELNHRVKNNLNMVSALINLKDSEIEPDLSDIEHQVNAIGIIHEKLYQTESVSKIDCKEYINELINYIFSSFTEKPVKIEETIDNINIPTKSAISLGLIINEIATNAVKHGFSDKEEARFILKLKVHDNKCVLTISNTGNPFPENIDIDSSQSLGLQLINSLVHQLKGTINIQKNPYPVFTIQIPSSKINEKEVVFND